MIPAVLRFERDAPDPAALAGFYVAALGFRRDAVNGSPDDGTIRLRLGAQSLWLCPAPGDRCCAPDTGSDSAGFQHLALVVADVAVAMARLRAATGWQPISADGPERLPDASGGATAFKFRDPAGHPLELLCFPPDGVPAPWRDACADAPAGEPFLGIDHSALSAADEAASARFYAGLGLAAVSRSLNRGPEQSRLDGVPDTAVAVLALRSPDGAAPGLELLCRAGLRPASPGRLESRSVLRADRDAALRDPDGHAVLLRR